MPFDSSGTFNRLRSWVADAAAGIKIRADYHDDEDNGFAAGLSQCLVKDGRTQPTANLPMNAKRLVNLGDPVAATDAVHKQYVDNAILAAQTAMAMPPGVMMPYTKSGTVPTGWLYWNGAAVSRATYANLFALIGTTFGAGNGSTTFNLPDMRGQFPRGWDDARGLDPSRTFGSTQTDNFESHNHPASASNDTPDHTHLVSGNTAVAGTHTHDYIHLGGSGTATYQVYANSYNQNYTSPTGPAEYTGAGASGADHYHAVSIQSGGASARHSHTITITAVGGTETRPHNVALAWIIKT